MTISQSFERNSSQSELYRVNRRIRVPEVRVIGTEGQQLGVLQTHEALRLAEEAGLDLVEIAAKAVPPVCKIMDYGKFKYEEAKKRKDAKKNQSIVELKEIKFRPKTDDHDFDFKVKHIRRFLSDGNKAKLVVIFRGREIVHPETGQDVLRRVYDSTSDLAQIEQTPMMEGRRLLMVLGPRSSKGGAPQPMRIGGFGGRQPEVVVRPSVQQAPRPVVTATANTAAVPAAVAGAAAASPATAAPADAALADVADDDDEDMTDDTTNAPAV